jgi:hypothetical protein
MIKKLGVLIIIAAYSLISAPLTSAHTLKSDGSIGAIIHISPEDDPIIGEPAEFFFEIKDKENKFRLENCHCEALILKDEKIIFSTAFMQHTGESNLTNASFKYTFPEKGVYKILLNGMPLQSISFKQFSLTYDIRVTREKESTVNNQNPVQAKSQQITTHYIILSAILFIFLLIIFWNKLKKKGSKSSKSKITTLILVASLVTTTTLLNLCYHSKILMKSNSHTQHDQHSKIQNEKHIEHPCCTIQNLSTVVAINLSPPLDFQILTITPTQKIYPNHSKEQLKNKSPPKFQS